MSQRSRIEWTQNTWNPTTGCTKISSGCKHCYAEAMAKRLQAMGVNGYENGFDLTILPERLVQPLKRKKPTIYFVNSMSDLFHEDIPDSFIQQVFDVIKQCTQHQFQILTKRAERMEQFFSNHHTNQDGGFRSTRFVRSVLPTLRNIRDGGFRSTRVANSALPTLRNINDFFLHLGYFLFIIYHHIHY